MQLSNGYPVNDLKILIKKTHDMYYFKIFIMDVRNIRIENKTNKYIYA